LKKKIFISGQEGMVGATIYKTIKKSKLFSVISCNRKDLDLTNQKLVEKWFKKNKPEIVINAAGKVGGILDNSIYQSDYLYINAMIGLNLINTSLKYEVKQFINLGSACIYPKNVSQPIKEDSLLSSQLEKSNEGYAIAKITCLKYCQYLKEKYNKNYISVQPANLYGVGDNFDLKSSHVLPALVKKFTLAKEKKLKSVEIWGSGNQKREFLNVIDLASAILFLLNKKIKYDYLNIGSGEQISIKELAMTIKKITGFKGKVFFNKDYPDGVKRRIVDTKLINKLGWKAKIKLKNGLNEYCSYYIKKVMPEENKI
jgi:GDP-L-fucose synthase